MPEEIKAIQTFYNGLWFRSRAEARWAVFFDALSIKYIYEPEGFVLPENICYLPDFYLPESNTFFEVKGIMTDKDADKIKSLLKHSGKHVAVGYPDMSFQASDDWWSGSQGYEFTTKSSSLLVKCLCCGKYYFMGNNGSYVCRCCDAYDGDHHFSIQCWGDGSALGWADEIVKGAFSLARQARFEHGETPHTNTTTYVNGVKYVNGIPF